MVLLCGHVNPHARQHLTLNRYLAISQIIYKQVFPCTILIGVEINIFKYIEHSQTENEQLKENICLSTIYSKKVSKINHHKRLC